MVVMAVGANQSPRVRSDRDVMSTEGNTLYGELCEILRKYAPAEIELTPATEFSGDLNIDSVAAMDLIMEVEDRFDIDIPMSLVSDLRIVQDLVDVVRQQIEGR
jgi:acyl carrier protein